MSAHFQSAGGRELPYPTGHYYSAPRDAVDLGDLDAKGAAGTVAALMLVSLWVGTAFSPLAVAGLAAPWIAVVSMLLFVTALPASLLLLAFLALSYDPCFGYGMGLWLSAISMVVLVNALWLLGLT